MGLAKNQPKQALEIKKGKTGKLKNTIFSYKNQNTYPYEVYCFLYTKSKKQLM